MSELEQLEHEARELYMQDPVRYDNVVNELLALALARVNAVEAAAGVTMTSATAAATTTTTTTAASLRRDGVDVAAAPRRQRGSSSVASSSTTTTTATTPAATHRRTRGVSVVQFGAAAAVPAVMTAADGDGDSNTSSPGALARAVGGTGRSDVSGGVRSGSSASSSVSGQLVEVSVPVTAAASLLTPPPLPLSRRRSTLSPSVLVALDAAEEAAMVSRGHCSGEGADEVQRILYEQMKAKLLLRVMLTHMRALWVRKQREADAKAREQLARAYTDTLAHSWHVERHRVLYLHKLIHLLDRRTRRVAGWVPYYSDDNVLVVDDDEDDVDDVDAVYSTRGGSRSYSNKTRSTSTMSSLSSTSLSTTMRAARGDSVVRGVCMRYVRLQPQRRLVRAMYLARQGKLLPLRVLRAQMQTSYNTHLLFGCRRQVLAVVPPAWSAAASQLPMRSYCYHCHRLYTHTNAVQSTCVCGATLTRTQPALPSLQPTAEWLRHRRRLQYTAAFQSTTSAYTPRRPWQANMPATLH